MRSRTAGDAPTADARSALDQSRYPYRPPLRLRAPSGAAAPRGTGCGARHPIRTLRTERTLRNLQKYRAPIHSVKRVIAGYCKLYSHVSDAYIIWKLEREKETSGRGGEAGNSAASRPSYVPVLFDSASFRGNKCVHIVLINAFIAH